MRKKDQNRFYAVKVGRKTGIYNSWAESKAQTNGFSNAMHKSFDSKEAAMSFLGDDYKTKSLSTHSEKPTLNIYVDGSYCRHKRVNGIGCVMVTNNKVFHTISKQTRGNDLWNVGAEIDSALTAVNWAIKNGYEEINIHYDYQGLEMWVNGSWNANNQITKNYARQMREFKKQIKIEFVKVKAHSGDKYNDLADELAKIAVKNKGGNQYGY